MVNKLSRAALTISLFFILNCENDTNQLYGCLDEYGCIELDTDTNILNQYFETLDDCQNTCELESNNQATRVTVFLYENCPIAQYMCGPLRNTYRYVCDTLNQDIVFRGFSPNAFSTELSLTTFQTQYDIPFELLLDYNSTEGVPGPYTQLYYPIATPEVFVEQNGEIVYRGMIDNSYQSLGQWSPPTENYLLDVLTTIINNDEIFYSETEPVGCLINY